METAARFAVALIVLAVIWYAVGGIRTKKRRKPAEPANDERNWQRAFMRDCKRGYPRH